jgi:hypothetical protein
MPSRAELQPDLSTLHPVNNSVNPPSAPAMPDATPRANPNIRTTLAPIQQMQPDQQRQFFKSGVPQMRISPPPTTAQPSINAQAGSVTKRATDPLGVQIAGLTANTNTALQSQFVGAWNASTTYFKGNTVVYSPAGLGSFYWVCIAVSSKGNAPTQASTFWQLVGTSAAVLSGLDGVLPSQTGQNLVFNGDFSIVSTPTGVQSTTASAIRTQDGPSQLSCNGWTRNFESSGNGEGICYQITSVAGQGLLTPFSYIMQGNTLGTGTNRLYAVVCDAFAVRPSTLYSFVANVNMGLGLAPDAHARWTHRVLWYKQGATDFSRFSSDLLSFVDVTAASAATGGQVSVGTLLSPATAGFCRVSFHHSSDGTPTADYNFWISNVRCTNTLDDITDGSTFGKVLQTGLTANSIDPSKVGVLAKGSTPSSLSSGFTYTSTTTTVTISWSGLTIYRADGSTTAITNSSQLVTGLTASTSYKVYPYWDETNSTVNFVTGGVGSPAICQTAGSNAISQSQNLQSRIPLSASTGFAVATPASGSGGGSGGGSGNCLHESMLVETNRGIVKSIDSEIGDMIRSEHGWETINAKKVMPAEIWVCVQLTDGSQITVTPSHPFTLPAGSDCAMKRAADLCLADFLITTKGVGAIKKIEVLEMKGQKVSITTSGPSHAFFAGKDSPAILAHNFLPS